MKKILLAVSLALGIGACMAPDCMAGEINGEEARVYSVASGTFSYNGETYRAGDAYLSQLSAYLCRDDIDLTSRQADAAISMINRKVAQGVTEGYLYKVSGDDTPTQVPATQAPSGDPGVTDTPSQPGNDSSQTSAPVTSSKPGAGDSDVTKVPVSDGNDSSTVKPDGTTQSPSATKAPDDGNSDKTSAPDTTKNPDGQNTDAPSDNTDDSGNSNINGDKVQNYQDSDAYEKREDMLDDRPDKEDSSGTITYNEDKNEIIIHAGTADKNDDIVISKDSSASEDSFSGKGTAARYKKLLLVVEIALLIIICLTIIVLFIFKCFSFQNKIKPHYGNHKIRRTLRRVFGNSLIFINAANICLIITALGIYVGCFQDSKASQTLSASGYYHDSYSELMNDIHTLMNDNCVPETAVDSIITYDQYLFATRNVLQESLDGNEASAEYMNIKEDVTESLNSVGYLTEDSTEKIGEQVLKTYQKYVNNIIGYSIYSLKQMFKEIFTVNLILAFVNILISFVCMLFMDHYKHRGMRKMAHSILIGAAAAFMIALIIIVIKPYTRLYINPDYLYVFVTTYIRYMAKVLALISAGGIVISVIAEIGAKAMRSKLTED